jgi:hypothetical protein
MAQGVVLLILVIILLVTMTYAFKIYHDWKLCFFSPQVWCQKDYYCENVTADDYNKATPLGTCTKDAPTNNNKFFGCVPGLKDQLMPTGSVDPKRPVDVIQAIIKICSTPTCSTGNFDTITKRCLKPDGTDAGVSPESPCGDPYPPLPPP